MRFLLATPLFLALTACDPGLPERVDDPGDPEVVWQDHWPEDTFLVVGDEPVTRSEVMAWVPTVQEVERGNSEGDAIRQVIANMTLHGAVARQADPAGRARARERAEAALVTLSGGEALAAEGPQVQRMHGAWNSHTADIGLDRWGKARDLEVGDWTMFETLGGFTVMTVVARPDAAEWTPSTPVTIEHVTYYYLDPRTMKLEIDTMLDSEGFELQVVDPEWEKYVPVHYLYRSGSGE